MCIRDRALIVEMAGMLLGRLEIFILLAGIRTLFLRLKIAICR